jgi:hypothetical protein
MSYSLAAKDWRELSEAASKEHDSKRLLELVKQLNEVLKRQERDREDLSHPEQRET